MEKDQGGPPINHLREFKRTDRTPEEQEQRNEVRTEARKRWEGTSAAAKRRGPPAETAEGGKVDPRCGGCRPERICKTTESLHQTRRYLRLGKHCEEQDGPAGKTDAQPPRWPDGAYGEPSDK